jgi:hypothetical protein
MRLPNSGSLISILLFFYQSENPGEQVDGRHPFLVLKVFIAKLFCQKMFFFLYSRNQKNNGKNRNNESDDSLIDECQTCIQKHKTQILRVADYFVYSFFDQLGSGHKTSVGVNVSVFPEGENREGPKYDDRDQSNETGQFQPVYTVGIFNKNIQSNIDHQQDVANNQW